MLNLKGVGIKKIYKIIKSKVKTFIENGNLQAKIEKRPNSKKLCSSNKGYIEH